jgi:hypothetical protein
LVIVIKRVLLSDSVMTSPFWASVDLQNEFIELAHRFYVEVVVVRELTPVVAPPAT